jgi:hypothetical protein
MDPHLFISVHDDRQECLASGYLEHPGDVDLGGIFAYPRVYIKKKGRQAIYQVYIQYSMGNWAFFDKYTFLYRGKPVGPKRLSIIDRQASGGGIREELVFALSKDEFKYFTEHEMTLKIDGKRGVMRFTIDKVIFKEVYEATSEYLQHPAMH